MNTNYIRLDQILKKQNTPHPRINSSTYNNAL